MGRPVINALWEEAFADASGPQRLPSDAAPGCLLGSSANGPIVTADRSREEKRELGVELLAHLEDEELSLAETIDRIETVTSSPSLTRTILDDAELQGIIEREDGRIRVQRGGTYVKFDEQVVTREGEFDCHRCGASISTGHFVQLQTGELGPFGPQCVRKVTGRE